MKTNSAPSLDVEVTYDEELKLIAISFSEDDRIITVGFDIHEAQILNIKIADAITAAILGKIGVALPPLTSKTKH